MNRKHLKNSQKIPAKIYDVRVYEKGWGWQIVLLSTQPRKCSCGEAHLPSQRHTKTTINVPINGLFSDFVLAVRRGDIVPQ